MKRLNRIYHYAMTRFMRAGAARHAAMWFKLACKVKALMDYADGMYADGYYGA